MGLGLGSGNVHPHLFPEGRDGGTPGLELGLGLGSGIVHPHLFPEGRDGGIPGLELGLELGSGIVHPHLFPQGRAGGNMYYFTPISSRREEIGALQGQS